MSEDVTMTMTGGGAPVASKKRKAAAPVEKNAAGGAKKSRSDDDRLTLLFVHGLPTNQPRKSAASGLLVGFNNQQLAQELYNELFGDSAEGESGIEQQMQRLLDSGVELSPYTAKVHVVTDGKPLVTTGTVDDLVEDARVRRQPLKVFVAKKFASRSLYPEVAVIVAPTEEEALGALAKVTAASTADNRPASVKRRVADIRPVNLTTPGFYRLSEGDFYDYKRN
jgi:hypothetical protein